MTFDLLIDGYNLMHFAGLARAKYGPGGFEQARDRFLRLLQSGLAAEERQRTTVVFDAQHAPHPNRTARHLRGMTVLFSPSGSEADDTIEELIRAHSAPQKLIVISSDHRLRRSARQRKAAWIDADSFLKELSHRRAAEQEASTSRPPQRMGRRDQELTASELEEWLETFGNVDVTEISAAVHREPAHPPRRSRERCESESPESAGGRKPSEPSEPGRRRHRRKRDRHITNSDSSARADLPILPGEVSFWEQRIAELAEEEDPAPRDTQES